MLLRHGISMPLKLAVLYEVRPNNGRYWHSIDAVGVTDALRWQTIYFSPSSSSFKAKPMLGRGALYMYSLPSLS